MAVFQSVPFIRTVWEEVVVALALVVAGVEEVFLIVETYGVKAVLLLCVCSCYGAEQEH